MASVNIAPAMLGVRRADGGTHLFQPAGRHPLTVAPISLSRSETMPCRPPARTMFDAKNNSSPARREHENCQPCCVTLSGNQLGGASDGYRFSRSLHRDVGELSIFAMLGKTIARASVTSAR